MLFSSIYQLIIIQKTKERVSNLMISIILLHNMPSDCVTISPPDTPVSTQTEERREEPAEGDAEPTSTPWLIREQGAQGGVFCGDLMLFMSGGVTRSGYTHTEKTNRGQRLSEDPRK